jgi:hypothetical protein
MVCLLVPILSFAADVLDYDFDVEKPSPPQMSGCPALTSHQRVFAQTAYSLLLPHDQGQWNRDVRDLSDGT